MSAMARHSKAASMPCDRTPWAAGHDPQNPEWVPVVTLVLWLTVGSVAGLGAWLSYPRPTVSERPQDSTKLEFLNVQLTQEPILSVEPAPALIAEPLPPSLPRLANPVTALPALAVAEPNPAISFPIPVQAPVNTTSAAAASLAVEAPSSKSATSVAVGTDPGPSAPQVLQYGLGEGKQPAPDYPAAARRLGQQGTVRVRFTVGADGRVLEAEAVPPAAPALLTEAALRTIRDRWRFKTGALRRYEVSVRFELSR